MSIQSVLIQNCIASIHKQLNQLEQWLITLPADSSPMPSIYGAIDKLSKQFEVQQHALNHIVDRLDMLEGMREQPYLDPWADPSASDLQNEIIEPLEPIYTIHKTETLFEPAPVALPSVQQESLPVQKEEPLPPAKEELLPVVQEEQKELVVEPIQQVPIEEEEEEEEEEEGLEMIKYKGTSYYKDSGNFIYRIEEDDQPSDTAIGYWKEKTQSVAFYKK